MFVLKYIQKKYIVFSSVFSLLYAVSFSAFLYQVKGFFEIIESDNLKSEIFSCLMISFPLLILSCVCMILQRKNNDIASNMFQQRIRDDLFSQIQTGSYDTVSKKGFASIATNILQDASACAGMIFGSLSGALTALLFWVTIFAVLAFENIGVFLLILAISLVLSVFVLYFRKLIQHLYTKYASTRETLNKRINEILRCKHVVTAYNTYETERNKLVGESNELKTDWLKCNVTTPIIFSSIEIAILLSYLTVFLLPRDSDALFGVTTAQIVLFTTYIPQLWSRYSALSSLYSSFVGAGQYSKRIENALTKSAKDCTEQTVDVEHLEPIIKAQGLSFSFGSNQILNNLSFEYKAPSLVYVCGKSGAGKSTLFNIITGLYRNYSGSLTVGGYEVNKLSASCIENHVGIVHQKAYMINGSALSNIKLFNDDITAEKVIQVAEKYNLTEYLGDLESTSFSCGQERMISIMRTLVRNPDIILFDEITADLDSYTETVINRLLSELSKQKLCLVIEHKTSSTAHTNEIQI